ncbi:MAG: hypothetical protein LBB28_00420 [Synergistaceae bacterium]|jgi:hypothetical protein|nr:hypothetical protein [Synergistaceae bacterium]
MRLKAEAPTLAAFPEIGGVVWLNADRYSLSESGGKLHESIYLMLLGYGAPGNEVTSRRIPYPPGEGAKLEIKEAAWYDQFDGERVGELAFREYDENGIKGMEIDFPGESEGYVIAVTALETVPGQYRLDDVLSLAGELPVWERKVEVEVPDGMRVYWEGSGVMEPERVKNGRIERITWTLMNEPVWKSEGLVSAGRPALVFSLDHGQLSNLKSLRELERAPYAPKIPGSVASARASLSKTVENIGRYMSARMISGPGSDMVRPIERIAPDGPWTGWEQVMIARGWLSSLGFDADIYWRQRLSVGSDGPDSLLVWQEPVIKVTSGKEEIYYKSGNSGRYGILHPSLYGVPLYRAGSAGVERIVTPTGSAAEHTLTQRWKVSIGEDGVASGVLDITVNGAWMNVLALDADVSLEELSSRILKNFNFNVPSIELEAKSMRRTGRGCNVSFAVNAAPGIVSGNDILFRLMGALPVCFEEIPRNASKYTLRFPFIFEINSVISTPKGYRTLSLPEKSQRGDSKAELVQSMEHWPRKRQAEASCRWMVRAYDIDEYISGGIAEQLGLVTAWTEMAIPLRK